MGTKNVGIRSWHWTLNSDRFRPTPMAVDQARTGGSTAGPMSWNGWTATLFNVPTIRGSSDE